MWFQNIKMATVKKNSSQDFEMGPHKQVDDFMVATSTLYTAYVQH